MRKRLSTLPLSAGFLLWGAGALDGFLNHRSSPTTYTLTLIGLVCLLVYYCVKNIETRLEVMENALELSRLASRQSQPERSL
jgi:hypothetical protein